MKSAAKAMISSNQMTRVVPPAPVATAGFQNLRSLENGKQDAVGWTWKSPFYKISLLDSSILTGASRNERRVRKT